MRIKGTDSTKSVKSSKKAKKTDSDANFASHLAEYVSDGESAATSSVESPTNVAGVNSIFSVQNTNGVDDREQKRRMIQQGENILDRLEEIRDGILTGSISKQRLIDLAQMVRNRRERGGDPRLTTILDEIELRAEVELAKLFR